MLGAGFNRLGWGSMIWGEASNFEGICGRCGVRGDLFALVIDRTGVGSGNIGSSGVVCCGKIMVVWIFRGMGLGEGLSDLWGNVVLWHE